MEQPETVDFEVSVMGGSTLSGLIPSLKAWLVGFARDSLINMYVMPEHWTYRLDPVSLLPLSSSSWMSCLPVYHEPDFQSQSARPTSISQLYGDATCEAVRRFIVC